MGKLVFLPAPSNVPDIWSCDCSSVEFEIYEDGSIVCSECETVQFKDDRPLLEAFK